MPDDVILKGKISTFNNQSSDLDQTLGNWSLRILHLTCRQPMCVIPWPGWNEAGAVIVPYVYVILHNNRTPTVLFILRCRLYTVNNKRISRSHLMFFVWALYLYCLEVCRFILLLTRQKDRHGPLRVRGPLSNTLTIMFLRSALPLTAAWHNKLSYRTKHHNDSSGI